MIENMTKHNKIGAYDPKTKELDISKLSNINGEASPDGTISKDFFVKHMHNEE